MKNLISLPRGTHDILPEQTPLWERLEQNARRILALYGYREIRTPIYEDIHLFKRSLGETSDVVHKQLLELKTSSDDDGLALRPEGTAAIVRSYLQNNLDKKENLSKLFYLGPMFRGERPQKGRLRQFHQLGVEAIGPDSASPFLDAEILALAMDMLKAFGVKGPHLLINSLGSGEDKARVTDWLRERLKDFRAKLCPDCQQRFERNVFRVLDCKVAMCQSVVTEILGQGQALPLSDESKHYFNEVKSCLTALNIPFTVSPRLVRGLDYYTHTVFEITAEGLGSQDAVGAGGRYSGLLHQLGGDVKVNFGAIGFAFGLERILLAQGEQNPIVPSLNAFMVFMDVAFLPQAFAMMQQMRGSGISAGLSYNGGSMKSQLNKANKSNARFAVILGDNEMKAKSVLVKNMQDASQQLVGWDQLIPFLKERL